MHVPFAFVCHSLFLPLDGPRRPAQSNFLLLLLPPRLHQLETAITRLFAGGKLSYHYYYFIPYYIMNVIIARSMNIMQTRPHTFKIKEWTR